VKENYPDARVVIFERSREVLAKVKISGGGRCNVTNGAESISELCKAYPRGAKFLKKLFPVFNNKHTINWFESRHVPLVVQDDLCVFPKSQDAQSIIDCFLGETKRLGIQIRTGFHLQNILPGTNGLIPVFAGEPDNLYCFDKIILATGGSPKRSSLDWLEKSGHEIADPVPSLFTFNMPDNPITALMGIVVENALVSIQGTGLKLSGPLLITHWGMSGPAILKLSSFGARLLSESGYQFKIQVNWTGESNQETVNSELETLSKDHAGKQLTNYRPYALPTRLWLFLLEKCELAPEKIWGDLGKKGLHKLVNILTNDIYPVSGRTTFRDEFVTCGGVSLNSIHPLTMESKTVKNLYFAGEILDIDAITGGFNFQAAWTTAYIAAQLK